MAQRTHARSTTFFRFPDLFRGQLLGIETLQKGRTYPSLAHSKVPIRGLAMARFRLKVSQCPICSIRTAKTRKLPKLKRRPQAFQMSRSVPPGSPRNGQSWPKRWSVSKQTSVERLVSDKLRRSFAMGLAGLSRLLATVRLTRRLFERACEAARFYRKDENEARLAEDI